MKWISVIVLMCFASASAYAAEKVSLRQNQNEIVQQMQSTNVSGASLFSNLATEDGMTYQMLSQVKSKKGAHHYKFQQYYKGLPVEGYTSLLKVRDGKVERVHGYRLDGIANDVTSVKAAFSGAVALNLAKKIYLSREKVKRNWVYERISTKEIIHATSAGKAHHAYAISFFVDTKKEGNPRKPYVVVDAQTGKLLAYHDDLHYVETEATGYGGNGKTGKYHHGTDFPALIVETDDNITCRLSTANVVTVNLNHTQNKSSTPFSFPCGENKAKEINGAYSPLNDAHAFGVVVFNMYKDWYGKSPLKNGLILRVHYGKDFENAFWDGQAMTFGDGKDTFYPLAVLDVTAHEVSHGFTQFNSNLRYKGQSGGINEAFSDMAGEAAEYYSRGTGDFIVGQDVFKKEGGLRFMIDPPKDGKSIDNVADFKHDAICDIFSIPGRCTDVHHSSGIFNKAFYLIATSQGWDIRKAFDIFVEANSKYWNEGSTFEDGARGAMDAAQDMGYSTDDVRKAFAQVGVNI